MGSKNHEVIPTPLIAQLSSIRSGVVTKCLNGLAKRGLVARVQGAKCQSQWLLSLSTCPRLPVTEHHT